MIISLSLLIKTNYLVLASNIDQEQSKYGFTEDEVKEIAQKLFELEQLKKENAKQEELIKGLNKEIALKDELIIELEKKISILEESRLYQHDLFEQALTKANETISKQEEVIDIKNEIIQEYKKQSSLSIIDKLKLIATGIAVYSIIDTIVPAR